MPVPAAPVANATPAIDGDVKLDKDGLPWDERIHAGSKGFTADGIWRRKRGVEDADFDAVQVQLRQLMNIPAPVPSALVPAVVSASTGNVHVVSAIPAAVPAAPVPVSNEARMEYVKLVGRAGAGRCRRQN